jgi:hypothetical protein
VRPGQRLLLWAPAQTAGLRARWRSAPPVVLWSRVWVPEGVVREADSRTAPRKTAKQRSERVVPSKSSAGFIGCRNGIESRTGQRMATRETADGERQPRHRTMYMNGLTRVFRARGHEAACPAEKWREQQLIEPDQGERETSAWCHGFDGTRKRLRAASKSCASAGLGASIIVAFGITTRSTAPASFDARNISRIRRLALFLMTAPPSFRDATTPSRAEGPGPGAPTSVRKRPWDRRPVSKTCWNSARRRSRRVGGRVWDGIKKLTRSALRPILGERLNKPMSMTNAGCYMPKNP